MSFDPNKPCRTRDGRAVEILTTKAAGDYQIIGNIEKVEMYRTWTLEGFYSNFDMTGTNRGDLVNYEPEPWKLPDPPHGYEWLRTDGWTKEMIPDGWRPYLKGEEKARNDEYYNAERKYGGVVGVKYDFEPKFWYITKRPLPAPKPKTVKVPLEPSDIPPGSIIGIRFRAATGTWFAVQGIASSGVLIATAEGIVRFDLLAKDWEIKRPGEEWKPCYKEVKAP